MGKAKERIEFDRTFYDVMGELSLTEYLFPTIYRRIFDAHAMSFIPHSSQQNIHDFLYGAEKRGYLVALPDDIVSPIRKKLVWVQRGRFLSGRTSFVLNNLYILTKKGGERFTELFTELFTKGVEDSELREKIYKETSDMMDKVMLSIDTLRSNPALLIKEYAISNLLIVKYGKSLWDVVMEREDIKQQVEKFHINTSLVKLPDFIMEKPDRDPIMVYILTDFKDAEAVRESARVVSRYADTALWYLSDDLSLDVGEGFKFLFELDRNAEVNLEKDAKSCIETAFFTGSFKKWKI